MNISFTKDAVKALERMDARTQQRIRTAILTIPKGDIKPMEGQRGRYRLRVGSWRVLFGMVGEDIVISDIGPRGQIYKGGR